MKHMVAVSKSDGHVYQSNPYTINNKDAVIDQIKHDLSVAGLTESDYTLVSMTEAELYDYITSHPAQ